MAPEITVDAVRAAWDVAATAARERVTGIDCPQFRGVDAHRPGVQERM